LLLGILVTVVAGVIPAVRATKVAPIAAAKGGLAPKVRSRRATIAGVVLLALAFGALALISGTAGVASRLVAALAALLGWPSRRFGGAAGRLASQNAIRNPQRTASTAA